MSTFAVMSKDLIISFNYKIYIYMSLTICICYSINPCPFLSNSIAVLVIHFLKLFKKREDKMSCYGNLVCGSLIKTIPADT